MDLQFTCRHYVYKSVPKSPVLTVAIKDILIARKELDAGIAYEIVETIVENKVRLIKMNDIYNIINFDFDEQIWAFPLHQGSLNYIEKDKPFAWVRWINILWPIISILVIFIGAFSSVRNKLRKRQRQNIEAYYISINEIKEKLILMVKHEEINDLLQELNDLKTKAIDTLANNKFDSGESFNIFLALYSELKNDLNERLKEIQNEEIET